MLLLGFGFLILWLAITVADTVQRSEIIQTLPEPVPALGGDLLNLED